MVADPLIIAGETIHSRLWVGTSRYPSPQVMLQALEAAHAGLVTVSVRRLNLRAPQETFLDLLVGRFRLLPNTAGCYTAEEAVFLAELSKEALQTNWIKLEVIGDEHTLWPDPEELLSAARELVKRGFIVLAYAPDDPMVCQRLAEAGCAAVMPLAAPIGSGQGIRDPERLALIRHKLPHTPLIIDAGIGSPSDAAIAMEMGYDGILVNTAIAEAQHPVLMAEAMRLAVEAGRKAYHAGRIPRVSYARPSSPIEGLPWS
ncbi:MAG: thiazole synthase [Bacteroidia bacterium]|nr:thiazole synthase [Bacteroidia bacterium]MCX7651615.1 thiazole synthase [Bacteroidia bacterium]MDW8417300.1 thiazole synthase [Bacteroidia bacterium]